MPMAGDSEPNGFSSSLGLTDGGGAHGLEKATSRVLLTLPGRFSLSANSGTERVSRWNANVSLTECQLRN